MQFGFIQRSFLFHCAKPDYFFLSMITDFMNDRLGFHGNDMRVLCWLCFKRANVWDDFVGWLPNGALRKKEIVYSLCVLL